jgi:hypothetical protein
MSLTTARWAPDTGYLPLRLPRGLWVTIRNDYLGNRRTSIHQLTTRDGKTRHKVLPRPGPNKRRLKLAPITRSKLTDGKSRPKIARLQRGPPQVPQVGECDVKKKIKWTTGSVHLRMHCRESARTIVLVSNKRLNTSRLVGHQGIPNHDCSSDRICA